MNQNKKYILQVTIVALMLNSAMPAQAIDWGYWSGYTRETISGFVASMPSKNQVIDRLKQPKMLGVVAVVSTAICIAIYCMKSKSQKSDQMKDAAESEASNLSTSTVNTIKKFLASPMPKNKQAIQLDIGFADLYLGEGNFLGEHAVLYKQLQFRKVQLLLKNNPDNAQLQEQAKKLQAEISALGGM